MIEERDKIRKKEAEASKSRSLKSQRASDSRTQMENYRGVRQGKTAKASLLGYLDTKAPPYANNKK